MWDEQERFARAVSKVFVRALIVLAVALSIASLATRSPAFLLVLLQFLAVLAALALIWAIVMGGLMAVLVGVMALTGRLRRAVRSYLWHQAR